LLLEVRSRRMVHGAPSASIGPSVRPPTPSYPTRRASNEPNIRPRRPD
jgi:hypothetical protein